MQYNLVRNGYLSSSGTVSLSLTELEKLKDGNTTSSGISITASGVLYLDLDMSQRIKVDDIRLYTNDTGHSSNVTFSYRNSSSEGFTDLVTSSGSSYYYTTIADPSAPRYLKVTVSGVDLDLYEFLVYNDDYIVAFGEDGTEYAKYLGNTPVNEVGTPTAVAIYNNSDLAMPADAYVSVDYNGNPEDMYLEISSSQNGTYYALGDGALLQSNLASETYTWNMGEFDNTLISSNSLVVDPPSTSGTYTTPIFGLDNKYMASYFVIDGTAVSGSGNISYDENTYNDTIRVRSSNTDPLEIEEIYWSTNAGYMVNKYNLTTLEIDDPLSSLPNDGLNSDFSLAVDRRSGRLGAVYGKGGWSVTAFITIVDRISGDYLDFTRSDNYSGVVFFEFDKNGGFWVSNLSTTLWHFDFNADTSNIESISSMSTATNIVYAAVEMDGLGIWYIEGSTESVYHLDYNCDVLNVITFGGDLTAICGTLDNGCWVADNAVQKVYRYSYNASLVKTVSLSRDVDFMCDDKANGFWYASDNSVYHVDSNGNEDVDIYIGDIYRLHAGHSGCVVSSQVLDRIYYVDKDSNSITHEYAESDNNTGMAVVFSYNHDDYVEFKNDNDIYPASDDPIWGPDGSLEWRVVCKDGYFLPKYKYHQAEITLQGQAEVDKVIMAPAVRVEDIQSKNYKNMYVKTNIPAGADITDYSTNLKAWWDIEDN